MSKKSEPLDTPTYRKTRAAVLGFTKGLSISSPTTSEPESRLEMLRSMSQIIGASQDGELQKTTKEGVAKGFAMIEGVIHKYPEARGEIEESLTCLLVAAVGELVFCHGQKIKSERRRIAPLAAQNQSKADVKDRAMSIAAELWSLDEAREIKTSEMADKIYRALSAEGFVKGPKGLPDTVNTINGWIKPIAPEYARKGGRPRNPPRT